MATEALAVDQTAQEHVEEVKYTDDAIKDVDKDICPESRVHEGKYKEKVKPEILVVAGVLTAESVAAITSEEKLEHKKDVHAAEEVKKEEAEDEKVPVPMAAGASETEETSKQEADSSTVDLKVGADSSAAVEPAVVVVEKELRDKMEMSDVPEPPKPLVDALAGDSEATSVQESEPEPAKEPAISEPAAQEVGTEAADEEKNTTPEAVAGKANVTPEAVAEEVVSVTESSEAELPIVSPSTEPAPDVIATTGATGGVKPSQGDTVSANLEVKETLRDKPSVTDPNIPEEVSEIVPEVVVDAIASEAAPVKEIKEEGEATDVIEEVPSATKLAEGDQDAATDKIDEIMQERTVVAKEPTVSNTTATDAATQVTEVLSKVSAAIEKVEEKEASIKGSVESSKDLAAAAAEVPEGTAAVTEEVPSATKSVEGGYAAASAEGSIPVDTNPIVESVVDKVDEATQEKTVAAEEPTVSGTNTTDAATQVTEVLSEVSAAVEKVGEKEANVKGSVESPKDLAAAAAAEVQQDTAAVTKQVPIATESAEGDQNAAASAEGSIPVDTNPIVESVVNKVDEATQEKTVVAEEPIYEATQEKTVVAEEPTVSNANTTDAATQVTEVLSEVSAAVEKFGEKEANVKGSVEPPRDLAAAAEVPQGTAAVTEQVPIATESAEGDQNAAASAEGSIPVDTNPVVESVVDKVDEATQEKTVVAVEPTVSDTTSTDAATQVTEVLSGAPDAVEKVEEKEASVKGSVKSSKDLAAAAEDPQDTFMGDEKASEGVEDTTTLVKTSRNIDDEKAPVESEKDAGEAPKAEAPAKSRCRSNNIFSKVKQSIVKLKKAIIGKSPSLKALPVEGKNEIKVK